MRVDRLAFRQLDNTGKTAVVGVKDRTSNKVCASVVQDTREAALLKFISDHVEPGALVYTDDASAYQSLLNHKTVTHSTGEYVRGQAHTNGIESFWATLKRAYAGTYHKISPKHLDRYVQEFAAKHNLRDLDTLDQMTLLAGALIGKRLLYRNLIADNGLSSGARS